MTAVSRLLHSCVEQLPLARDRLREWKAAEVENSTAKAAPHLTETNLEESFICPLTLEIMENPVITADGHTYEREAIALWLQTHNTSPSTGERLEHTHLIPNVLVRSQILQLREQQLAARS